MSNEMQTGGGHRCPHCEQELTAEQIKTLWAGYTQSLRQTIGGPQKQQRPCRSCGMMCDSARGAWSHCRIPRNLDAEALLAYVLGRMPVELTGALGRRHESLESLADAILELHLDRMDEVSLRQTGWYTAFVDRALGKLEDVA